MRQCLTPMSAIQSHTSTSTSYLRELATRRYGAPPSTAKSQWVVWAASSISIAVQRGNATAFESARSLIMFGGAAHGRAPSRGHRR